MNARLANLSPPISVELPGPSLARLRARYAEPHRRYHTWSHVLACFDARAQLTRGSSPEVDLALLFHDAVYDPLARDNEAKSALLLLDEGRRAWLDEGLLRRAARHVEATRHDPAFEPDCEEGCIVLDADLAILGADGPSFDEYERSVRQEYAAVDDETYAAARSAILRALLERPNLYLTRTGARLWEGPARRNIERSLARLTGDLSAIGGR
jgi:predicted metal-dependent HD superfamily phosphohydrolase